MFWTVHSPKRWIAGLLFIAVLASILVAPPAFATFQQLLQENWERPVGTPFPWSTNGHPWQLYPTSASQPRWDIERNAIYHSDGSPDHVTAVWCCGSLDNLQAGIDPYPGNMLTYLYWGPFSTNDPLAINGSLWMWGDMESNSGNSGDFFYIATRQGGFSPSITAWDYLYKNDQGGNGMMWQQILFDYDRVITAAGDTISYIDEGITSSLYLALVFKSDGDANDHLGVFVDDVALGWDDGLFDFDYRGYELFDPNDPNTEMDFLFVNTPAQMSVKFKAHGGLMSNVVTHTLFNANNQAISSITGQWQGGTVAIPYEEPFDLIFTPQQPGTMQFSIFLDVDQQQPESDEDNNDGSFEIEILPENTPPEMTWVNPGAGGATNHDNIFDIIYYAENQPELENARISFYYDDDNQGFNGSTIPGGTNLPINNELDTLAWYIAGVGYGEYWLHARLTDDYHDPVNVYADGPIIYTSSVNENDPSNLPSDFRVTSVYPNPFNPTVEVAMQLPGPGQVRATWYSVDGREVDVQNLGVMGAGSQKFSWTPTNLTSGVYLLRLESPFGTISEKVTYLK